MHTNHISTSIVHAIWRNWAMAFGAPAAVTVCSILIPPVWLPLVCLLLAYLMMVVHRRSNNPDCEHIGCSLILWLTMVAMIGTAALMMLINLVYSPKVIPTVVAENPALPFITSLVVYPLMCAVSVYGLLMERDNGCCRRCQASNGYYDSESSVAVFYFRETRSQLRLMLILSAVISLVDLVYYFVFYVNVSLNTPDRFFFLIVPVAVFVLSLGFMAIRYFRIYYYVVTGKHHADSNHSQFTIVRFLLLCGDHLLLTVDESGVWDTPVLEFVPRHRGPLPGSEARRIIDRELHGQEFQLRFMYENGNYVAGANVLHYAAILPEGSDVLPQARRCTFGDVQDLLRNDALSPYITNELYRIHTMAMAWKTYDKSGRRLYPIRNYRPTLRLRDFSRWNVDYNDTGWLEVAHNNEDKLLYHVRRFINRYLLFQKEHTASNHSADA